MAKNDDENVVILEEAETQLSDKEPRPEEQEGGESDELVSLDELEPVVPEQTVDVQDDAKKSKKKLFIIAGSAGTLVIILAVVLFFVFRGEKKPPIDEKQIVKDIEEH